MASLLLEIIRHPIMQIIQIQACLVLCVGVVGWTLSGLRRRRELLRLQAAGHRAFLQQRAGMDSQAAACADLQSAGHTPAQPAQAHARPQGPARSAVLQEKSSRCEPGISVSTAAACSAEAEPGEVTSPGRRQPAAAAASASAMQHCSPALFKSRCSSVACTSHTSSCRSDSSPAWPPLVVILPVKGCRPHSTENWASQLDALYDGLSVFVFVVESASDPAVAAVAGLMQQQGALCLQQLHKHTQQQQHWQGGRAARAPQNGKQQLQQQWPPGVLTVWQQQQRRLQQQCARRLVVVAQAGLASTCSQKIHNILHAVEVGKALLCDCQQLQQQQQQQQVSALKQPHSTRDGVASSVHILAVAAGGSTDGSSSGSNSGSAGNSSSGSRDGSTCDDVVPAADVHSARAAAAGVHVLLQAAKRQALLPPAAQQAAKAADGAAAAAAAAAQVLHAATPYGLSGGREPQQLGCAAAAGGSVGVGVAGGYVCILDDDVLLHPVGLMQLVDELEADPGLFMATGYPFDIVAEANSSSSSFCGRLLSYATASYHLPLTIGFSIADRGNFVWGGAIMLRAAALEEPPPLHAWQQQQQQQQLLEGQQHQQQQQQPSSTPSILKVWREGGYSDDMMLAAYCVDNGLSIGLPASALFPQLLPPTTSWGQYWNYLRRQLFVLDTYYNEANRVANHTLMLLHSYGSAVFIIAVTAAALQLLLLAAMAAAGGCCLLGAQGFKGEVLIAGEIGRVLAGSAGRLCSAGGG